jgi:hypothetical protein
MSINLQQIEARRCSRRVAPSHDCPDAPVIDADLQALIDELARARREVAHLMRNEVDLRGSAESWCRLYEANLARAQRAEAVVDQVRGALPVAVDTLFSALDRVAALTKALGAIVQECGVCAQNACDAASLTKIASEACARCRRALEALSPR